MTLIKYHINPLKLPVLTLHLLRTYWTAEIEPYSRKKNTCDEIYMDRKWQLKTYLRLQTYRPIQGPTSHAEQCLEALGLQSSYPRNSNDYFSSAPIMTEKLTKTLRRFQTSCSSKQWNTSGKEPNLKGLHSISWKLTSTKITRRSSHGAFLKLILPWVLECNKI